MADRMTGDVEASGKGTAIAYCAGSPSTRSAAILTPPIEVASSAGCHDRQGCRTGPASSWCLRCTIGTNCRHAAALSSPHPPSTRYTLARPFPSLLAISEGLTLCDFNRMNLHRSDG